MAFNFDTVAPFASECAFPCEPGLYRTTSGLADGPLSCDGRGAENLYFPSADKQVSGSTKVISENNVSQQLVRDMIAFLDGNGNGLKEETEKELFTYRVLLFVSKDDSYLQQAYAKTEPAADEVCIFLEDNSTDLFSGKTSYIKIGSLFRDNLKKQKEIGYIEQKFAEKYQVYSNADGEEFALDFTGEEIQELITTGKITNTSSVFFIGLLQFLNIQSMVMAPLYELLGDFILGVTEKLRYYFKFSETSWDPDAPVTDEEGNQQPNDSFQPALLPFSIRTLKTWAAQGEGAVKKVTDGLRKGLEEEKARFDGKMQQVIDSQLSKYPGADGAIAFVQQCAELELALFEKMISACENAVPFFVSFGERYIYILNAYFCGLWNSLLEAVLGIVDLVGYLFKAMGMIGNAMKNAQTLIPQALEMIDEMIQTLSTVDFSSIFSEAVDEIIAQLKKLDLSAWASEISLEKVAYFLGGLTGFVLQVLISIYWSGGLDGIRAAVEKIGSIGKGVVDFIKSSVEKLIGIAAGLSIEGLVKVVQQIIQALKSGAKAVVEFIRAIFEALKRGFRTLEELFVVIKEMLKLTSEDEQAMKELGLQFTSLIGKTCTLCKITS